MDEQEHIIHTATDLFGSIRIAERYKPSGAKATTERGELLVYFSRKTGWDIPRLARKLADFTDLRDWYYFKSNADAYEREGKGAWSRAFFGTLKQYEETIRVDAPA